MIAFIMDRETTSEHRDMLEKWNWLRLKFGEPSSDQPTWRWQREGPTFRKIRFTFDDESIATWFRLQFPEVLTVEEYYEKP